MASRSSGPTPPARSPAIWCGHAELVGSREFADIFRDAATLWPDGRIPRDRVQREQLLASMPGDKLAALDERYVATQYRRKTALALVLGGYIRAHLDDFVVR